MDNRLALEKLTQAFNRADLAQFFRVASGKLKPEKEDYKHFLEKAGFVKDLVKLGKIDFEDKRRLVVLVGQLDKELTSHSGKLRQYEIARKVLKNDFVDAGIFVFHDGTGHFRFSLITAQYTGTKKEYSNFRRYTYFVTPESGRNRTFVEQVGKAEFASIDKILEAFSVEPVTKDFFRDYKRIFDEAEATITLKWDAEQKRLYTQRFFNRMLFMAFLERKGWLTFNGRKDYLRALFKDYDQNETSSQKRAANFHRSRLNILFFKGLNNPHGDQLSKDPEYKIFQSQIGEVPYLNGGLFDKEADDETWFFPDAVTEKILSELIYRYNFTVTESTPLDVEVAVDPEMLGKIFEELVTGRHESGSYYTPKPVVAFMCREALKGYLGTALPAEKEDALTLFIDKNDPAKLRSPELVLEVLKAVKVCDPACGSGAYLLGMMHELLEQRECLFAAHVADAAKIYDRKLEIIRNNLYGVDLDPFAVNIARLRLWLSLIVDFEGDKPLPLPNLDFKIESGDSLTAPDPSGGLQPDMFRQQQVQEFLRLKNEFMSLRAGAEKKKKLDQQIKKLRSQIGEWAHPKEGFDKSSNAFDWQVDFAEIFAPELAEATLSGKMSGIVNAVSGQMEITETSREGGFDIILANPPYVRADAQFRHISNERDRQKAIDGWKKLRLDLVASKIYKTLYEKWDLYIPFLERAFQLLRVTGQMVFIIPDSYNASKYTAKSHDFFVNKSRIERIDYCSEIPLFDAGVFNTILHISKNNPLLISEPIRVKRWGQTAEEFDKNLSLLISGPQQQLQESLFRSDYPSKSTKIDISKCISLGQICYISKGMVVHADERTARGAFTLDDLISPVQDKTHPKAFVLGRDLARWYRASVRYLEWGTKRAPSLFSRPTFAELHNAKEKLLARRISGDKIIVTYDDQQLSSNQTVNIIVPWHYLKDVRNKSIQKTAKYRDEVSRAESAIGDFREDFEKLSVNFMVKYLLAVMNSSVALTFVNGIRKGDTDILPDEWKHLPVAKVTHVQQVEIVKIVDKILSEYKKYGYPLPEKPSEKMREWEGQLDEMVSRLYEG